ncbi:MAG: hypothetical protein ACOC9O_03875 [Myxococcota bacterium]
MDRFPFVAGPGVSRGRVARRVHGLVKRLSIGVLLVAGCASGRSLHPGTVEAPPSMEVLPEPDVPVEDMTKRMRFAWLLAEQSFEPEPPTPPPPSVPVLQVQRWADEELEPWLARKNELVEAARAELDAAAERAHRQRIVAGALVGLMYEDMVRVLRSVPVPEEIRREPEIARTYREIVESQAAPYLEHARRAYRACAANATRPRGMRHWSSFCAGRLAELPEEALASGETEVTVTVDR